VEFQLLKKATRHIYTDNVDNAKILNDHFSSVFTVDNSSVDQISSLDSSRVPEISPLHIDAEDIKPLLKNMNAHKSHGPDGILASKELIT